jgi:hypothetical protein
MPPQLLRGEVIMRNLQHLLLAASLSLGALACGSDSSESTPPANTGGFTDDDAGTLTKDGGVTKDGGSGGGKDGGSGNGKDGGTADDGGTPETDGAVEPSCEGPGGCYACEPGTSAQFLNQCVDKKRGITAVPFDNAKRIPGYKPGELPTLP